MRAEDGVSIRIVRPSDYEAIARLFQNNDVDEVTRYFHPFPLTCASAKNIACTAHEDRYYVVFYRGKMCGLCMLRGWDEGYSIPSYGVLLDRQVRGQGVGRKTTEFAISEAEKLGCQSIRLTVHSSHVVARRLYIDLGFVETERIKVDSTEVGDDVLIMHKRLNT